MTEPTVCCVMLTKDRPKMAARAVESFRRQTYGRRRLLIYDNSAECPDGLIDSRAILHFYRGSSKASIGELRNEANEFAMIGAAPQQIDIIAHWDSDDWSHPNRLTEQVALLQASAADCVGYNDMLFWDERQVEGHGIAKGCDMRSNEAWLYSYPTQSYVLGTSMLYWRKTWEAHPFDHLAHGEDERFRVKCKTVGVSSMSVGSMSVEPRMIESIHGGNSAHYEPKDKPAHFRRVPKWDAYCAKEMRL